jgi:rod shape-determining protein MreC
MTPLSSDRRRPPLFPRGPGVGLRAFLLAVIAIGLLVLQQRSASLQSARQWAAAALQPLIWAVSVPSSVSEAWHHYLDRGNVYVENQQLRQKQLILEAQLQKLAALQAENERLRGLLSSAVSLQQRVLVAEILTVSQDPYRHQIVLNKGRDDGVYRGQALVDAFGVLGQVIEVNPHNCVALLITDPNHGIPVEINRTGLQTIALGRGDGFGLSLPYLPGNADVKVGDLLVSSGLGGRSPAGYPVGEIHELRHNQGETFMEAIAYPSAHINQGRQALLVWSENSAEPLPSAEPAPPPPPAAAAPRKKAKPRQ